MKPLARLVGYAIAGVDPNIMGIGPVPAIRKLLKISNLELKDIGLVEVCLYFKSYTNRYLKLICSEKSGLGALDMYIGRQS